VEVCDCDYSLMGKEAMSFKSGVVVMRHALGRHKPWNLNPISQIIKGRPPRGVDKDYWKFVASPIAVHSKGKRKVMMILMSVTSFVGRFYRRNENY